MESSFCIAVMSGIPTRMTPSGIHLERKQIYYHGVIQSVIHEIKILHPLICLALFIQAQGTLKLMAYFILNRLLCNRLPTGDRNIDSGQISVLKALFQKGSNEIVVMVTIIRGI